MASASICLARHYRFLFLAELPARLIDIGINTFASRVYLLHFGLVRGQLRADLSMLPGGGLQLTLGILTLLL